MLLVNLGPAYPYLSNIPPDLTRQDNLQCASIHLFLLFPIFAELAGKGYCLEIGERKVLYSEYIRNTYNSTIKLKDAQHQ